jgi:hypothetical protein
MPSELITLRSGRLTATVSSERVKLLVACNESSQLTTDQCRTALLEPIGLPELCLCVVPGDLVSIVIDPATSNAIDLLAVVCEQLQSVPDGGVTLTLLLPPDPDSCNWASFVEQLPLHVQQQLTVHVHDPAETAQLSYVASSADGERIYVNRRVADADLLVTIGTICFDSLLGYRGTTSGIYPAFSDNDAIQQARTLGHPELTPDEPRPYRQLVDEVGWLLGTQFVVQIVPGPHETALAILAGLPEDVLNAGKEIVDRVWRVKKVEHVEAVLLSVPSIGTSGWTQFGIALEQAVKIVEPDGRIIVVADLPIPEGPAASLLRRCREPEELLKPLRREPSVDAVEITQLINALNHARVYLFSLIPADIVEELGMIAIEDADELQRLTSASENCVALPHANFAWVV